MKNPKTKVLRFRVSEEIHERAFELARSEGYPTVSAMLLSWIIKRDLEQHHEPDNRVTIVTEQALDT